MKICSKCNTEKNLTEFARNKTRKDGLQANCKQCQREYVKKHYENNVSYYVDKARRRNISQKEVLRAHKDVPCKDCGVSYPFYVMDFDHRENKSFEMSRGWDKSQERLLRELAKCDIVCSNCHRERTWQRANASIA